MGGGLLLGLLGFVLVLVFEVGLEVGLVKV